MAKEKSNPYSCIVIGGGPAGMIASGRAASLGKSVCLIERNHRLGEKLLISGGGRCNFTNATFDLRQLSQKYGEASKALLSPFNKFGPEECIEFFGTLGMPHKVEDNGRCFPLSNSSASVLAALEKWMKDNKVRVETGSRVTSISHDGSLWSVETARDLFSAHSLILATGGMSHPETGSTGDGFGFVKKLGLPVRIPEPSLVPIVVNERFISKLSGISFQDIGLELYSGDQKKQAARGKLLFTHFGLSGPLVLNNASLMHELKKEGLPVHIYLDFFPDLDHASLDRSLIELFATNNQKILKNVLPLLVANKIAETIIDQAKIVPDIQVSHVTKDQRRALVTGLKKFALSFKKLMDESRAVVSSGGVGLDEIDFRTMTAKGLPNMAIVGDLIDINRPSGGYSLQLCWSTGWVAGTWAGELS